MLELIKEAQETLLALRKVSENLNNFLLSKSINRDLDPVFEKAAICILQSKRSPSQKREWKSYTASCQIQLEAPEALPNKKKTWLTSELRSSKGESGESDYDIFDCRAIAYNNNMSIIQKRTSNRHTWPYISVFQMACLHAVIWKYVDKTIVLFRLGQLPRLNTFLGCASKLCAGLQTHIDRIFLPPSAEWRCNIMNWCFLYHSNNLLN